MREITITIRECKKPGEKRFDIDVKCIGSPPETAVEESISKEFMQALRDTSKDIAKRFESNLKKEGAEGFVMSDGL